MFVFDRLLGFSLIETCYESKSRIHRAFRPFGRMSPDWAWKGVYLFFVCIIGLSGALGLISHGIIIVSLHGIRPSLMTFIIYVLIPSVPDPNKLQSGPKTRRAHPALSDGGALQILNQLTRPS